MMRATAPVAQRLERTAHNGLVAGSIPARRTIPWPLPHVFRTALQLPVHSLYVSLILFALASPAAHRNPGNVQNPITGTRKRSTGLTAELAPGPSLYSVSQLAHDLGVTARTIRFYEDKNLVTPQRAGTTRVFSHRDRARLVLILRGKRLGFSLREIKEFLDLYDADPQHHLQTLKLQTAVRKRLLKLCEQRLAIEQSLAELNEIDRQCADVLARHAT